MFNENRAGKKFIVRIRRGQWVSGPEDRCLKPKKTQNTQSVNALDEFRRFHTPRPNNNFK